MGFAEGVCGHESESKKVSDNWFLGCTILQLCNDNEEPYRMVLLVYNASGRDRKLLHRPDKTQYPTSRHAIPVSIMQHVPNPATLGEG